MEEGWFIQESINQGGGLLNEGLIGRENLGKEGIRWERISD